jgi:uncharacterized protein (TIGR02453 family)
MPSVQEFEGFPPSALKFLADLKKNNNRDWFNDHKSIYKNDLIEPAKGFIVALGSMLKGLHPGINFDTRTNGSGSMFRIYRDVRFSKDKSPYKTHLGIVFWLGPGKKKESPGFYVGIDPSGAVVYGGLWQFSKDELSAYRKAVDDPSKADELESIVKDLSDSGYEIGGQSYKRVPRGFSPDHPHANLLRHKSLHAGLSGLEPSLVTSPLIVPEAFNHCANYLPMIEWLSRNVT